MADPRSPGLAAIHFPDLRASMRIAAPVKLEVWKRDAGKCSICGATDELHFDHIVPFAKGGTPLTVANVQLLCARHNIQKSSEEVVSAIGGWEI
jgi:5-methylcytosine-specific restriction endonuclease McrA